MKMEKDPYFKPSVTVDVKQVVIIILVLAVIAATPFIIRFVKSGGSSSIGDIVRETIESFKITTDTEVDSPFIVTIPVINTDVNLTVIKQNPQIITYLGLGFVTGAILVGITLIRSLWKD